MRYLQLSRVAVWLFLGCGSIAAPAAPVEFDCKDPKGVHNISFVLDSRLEPIMGLASGITGIITFDPDDPKATHGTIVVASETLHTENQAMKNKLHESEWMDVEGHPTIEFTFKKIKKARQLGDHRWELTAVGDFTCRGVTREITVPVVATYLPDMLGQRMRGAEGHLLVLRSEFTIKRTDYGIKPDMGDLIVADEIELRIAIVGHHKK